MSVQSAYEKMLKNPQNRISTSGMMKQPMPNESNIGATADLSKIPGKDLTDPVEDAYMADVDARMKARASGTPLNEGVMIGSLEKRVKEIEELLVEVMKTHMKLLEKL
jgi:hypothetical protein